MVLTRSGRKLDTSPANVQGSITDSDSKQLKKIKGKCPESVNRTCQDKSLSLSLHENQPIHSADSDAIGSECMGVTVATATKITTSGETEKKKAKTHKNDRVTEKHTPARPPVINHLSSTTQLPALEDLKDTAPGNTVKRENVKTSKLNPQAANVESVASVDPRDVMQTYKRETYGGDAPIPKGKPKSGRKWKTEQTSRFSTMKQGRESLRPSWAKKMEKRAEHKNLKKFEAEIKAAKSEELDKKKKFRAKKMKRKFENQRKSEIVEVIKNPAKIKRMKKKQLRQIEHRSMPDFSKAQIFV